MATAAPVSGEELMVLAFRVSPARWLMAVGLLPTLAACILSSEKLDPTLDIPPAYKESRGNPGAALPPPEWWRSFRSTELSALVETALTDNYDIAAAVARIVQADALARVAGAPLLPTLDFAGNVTRSRPSSNTTVASGSSGSGRAVVTTPIAPDRTLYNVNLSASYILDFWGRNADALRAAEQTAAASRFTREIVSLTTIVTVANTYFLVLEAQDRLRIARNNLASAERILSIFRDRFNLGTASALELAQQESLVAIVRASIPPLVQQAKQNIATLAVLIGRPPESVLVRGGSLNRVVVPRVTPGIPSELLTRRPDIREAEAKLASADASVQSARKAFLPTIQLTGQGGFQSAVLRTLLGSGSGFYSVAAGLMQPILDGGTLQGQLEQQKGIQEELLQLYRRAVVSAFGDVDKALIAIQQTTEQERLQRAAVEAARRAFRIVDERLRGGTVDITTVLQAQQTLFQAEDTLAIVRFARLQAIVSLFQALGGGWLPDYSNEPTPVPLIEFRGPPPVPGN